MLVWNQDKMYKQFTVNTLNGPVIEVRTSPDHLLIARAKEKKWSNGTSSYWVYDSKGNFIDSGKKSEINIIVEKHITRAEAK